jgi:hypothetical protein
MWPGNIKFVRFEVFTAVTMKRAVLWDVDPRRRLSSILNLFSVLIRYLDTGDPFTKNVADTS